MRFLQFKEQLKDFTVFSLADIRMVESAFHRRRLSEWQEKGYIKKIVRGYYIFSDLHLSEQIMFEIANRIYLPSYVSFETALAFYGLIPESVYEVCSASTRKTNRFSTPVGRFGYRTVMAAAFFGYTIITENGGRYKIAEIEKALIDYLYLHAEAATDGAFQSLRLNTELFHEKVDPGKLALYAGRIGQAKLGERVEAMMRFVDNA
jgi:predicted transcriptional regulator of viral defense system